MNNNPITSKNSSLAKFNTFKAASFQRVFKVSNSKTPLSKSARVLSEFAVRNMKGAKSPMPELSHLEIPNLLDEILIPSKSSKLPTKLEVLSQFITSEHRNNSLGSPATRKDVQDLAD